MDPIERSDRMVVTSLDVRMRQYKKSLRPEPDSAQTDVVPLSTNQLATLRAAIDRIVPADDFPSASESGVADFLTQLIPAERLDDLYMQGLDALDAEASAIYEKPFAQLTPDEQDHLLAAVEFGDVRTPWSIAPQEFFEVLNRQTIDGYYGDPGNGGNRDGAAWRMVGFQVTS